MRSLLADVVAREPLAAADGRSGSLLERVVLADGRALVVKHVRDGGDWIMRASHDHGRAAELWSSGVLARVPDVIDHAVVGAERAEDGWVVIMRDVSALVPDHARLTAGDSRRVLAAAALHARFWDEPPLHLCSMVDRYRFLSPATARREAAGDDEVPRLIGRGWERFAEVVPADVAGPVLAVLERPEPFAAALSAFGSTLLQGDLKLGNLGLTGDRVVMLDWGTQTGWGPRRSRSPGTWPSTGAASTPPASRCWTTSGPPRASATTPTPCAWPCWAAWSSSAGIRPCTPAATSTWAIRAARPPTWPGGRPGPGTPAVWSPS